MRRHPQTRPDLPGALPPYVWRDGLQYFSMPELARRWGMTRQGASAWAHRHPDKTVRVGLHIYARDQR